MVIGLIGENCSGKSTLAAHIRDVIGAEVVTGRDYLRMAKSEAEARRLFRKKLAGAVSGGNIIYVISESDQLDLLPKGAVRILVSADLDTIKARFRARMRGFCPRRSNGCLKANMACLTTALMIISMTEPMAMRLRCARN